MFFVYRITNKRLNKHYYGSRHAKHATIESLGTTYFSSSKNADFIEDQKKNPPRIPEFENGPINS